MILSGLRTFVGMATLLSTLLLQRKHHTHEGTVKLQLLRKLGQLSLEYFQRWRFHSLPEQPFPTFDHPSGKTIILLPNGNFHVLTCLLSYHCTPLRKARLDPVCSFLLKLQTAVTPQLSLLELNKAALSASPCTSCASDGHLDPSLDSLYLCPCSPSFLEDGHGICLFAVIRDTSLEPAKWLTTRKKFFHKNHIV